MSRDTGETRRARRSARVRNLATTAGVVAGLTASTLAGTASAVPGGPGDRAVPGAKSAPAGLSKLGARDASLLAAAKQRGDRTVTMMVAAAPGAARSAANALKSAGAYVGKVDSKLGYVRVTVPTGKAGAVLKAAQRSGSVQAVDLNEMLAVPDTTGDESAGAKASPKSVDASAAMQKSLDEAADLPRAGAPYLNADPDAAVAAREAKARAAKQRRASSRRAADGLYPAPDKTTPRANPYMPVRETGSDKFTADNPSWDGRGVTIGVLDSGVDLSNPALQKTSTGERKVSDWITATDPLVDGDGTWLPMLTKVNGPEFTFKDVKYKAPAGSYLVNVFKESATAPAEVLGGDVNLDGDTKDVFAVLYNPANGDIRVDTNTDQDFTNDTAMQPYKKKQQVGKFGKDNPDTQISEEVPFTVEPRKNVDLSPAGGDWVGKSADYVSIGVSESSHATHVAGITAANGMFGGQMSGQAPGAKVVSSRACWGGGCTSVALTEGMVDLAANRGVDVINMSIGGLPALNDGSGARAELYERIIDRYGVQLVVSAGNEGPGMNTVGDPSVANKVISVGASVSKDTWAANYGSTVAAKQAMFPFSSRGPREDGGFKPTLSAPGAAISSYPTWIPGAPIAEAGYALPAGYGMANGTSMASPQAAGGIALLLSAAKAKGIDATPARLRTAVGSSAKVIDDYQIYEQGSGLLNVPGAWKLLAKGSKLADDAYAVKAPVKSELSSELATPDKGEGIYDRGRPDQGGPLAGKKKTYSVSITRKGGPAGPVTHELSWVNNDGTFSAPKSVKLRRGEPTTVKVASLPKKSGAHSAVLNIDNPSTAGVDHKMMATIVADGDMKAPSFSVSKSGRVDRNQTEGHFVNVPEGATSLEISISNTGAGKTTYFASNPYGLPTVDYSFANPNTIVVRDPMPGVWNIGATASRASELLSNPYTIRSTVYGVNYTPSPAVVEDAKSGQPVAVSWKGKNAFAPVNGTLTGGELGSSKKARPSIDEGDNQEYQVEVPAGASKAEFTIGKTADLGADLDLSVSLNGAVVGSSADGDAEESVVLSKPAAGTYTVTVAGYQIPSGSTAYDYLDVFYSPTLGTIKVDGDAAVKLPNGADTELKTTVTAVTAAAEGRTLFGEVALRTDKGTVAGVATVHVKKVTG